MKKTNSNGKWIVTAVAFVLAFVLIVGLCLQVFGTGKARPSEWFKKDEQTEKLPAEENEENTASVVTGETIGNGVRLLSTTRTVSDASGGYQTVRTLTATVLPEDADNKRIVWSYAWKDASSEWVNIYDEEEDEEIERDVSEYLTVTPSENTQSASIKVLQPYGEPIIVKATSEEDQTKYATQEFGFIKRVETFNFTGTFVTTDRIDMSGNGLYSIYPEWTLTDGTVEPVVTPVSATFRIISNKGSLADYRKDYTVNYYTGFWVMTKYDNFFTREVTVSEAKAYFQMLENETAPLLMTFTLSITSDKDVPLYETTRTTQCMKSVSAASFQVAVTGVSFDSGAELYF